MLKIIIITFFYNANPIIITSLMNKSTVALSYTVIYPLKDTQKSFKHLHIIQYNSPKWI